MVVIITPRAHARSGVKQWVLSVSQSVSVSVSVSSKFWADHDNEGSKRHSNNDNSEKTVHGVPEGG